MKKRFLSLITIILAMVMCLFTFVGCSKDDLKGFDIDLAKAVGEELGIDVEFKLIDWNMKDMEGTAQILSGPHGIGSSSGRFSLQPTIPANRHPIHSQPNILRFISIAIKIQ